MFGIPFTGLEWQEEYCPKELDKLPKIWRHFEEFSVKKIITLSDIIQDYKYPTSQIEMINKINDIKEQKIKDALKELYQQIFDRYKKIADYYKLELIPENFHDEILQDVTYYDLIPGNTAISFEIKTIRCLIKNQSL